MRTINKRACFVLLVGLIFFSATTVYDHYARPSDYFAGFLKGIGIGLMLLAVFVQLRGRRVRSSTGSTK